MRKTLGLCTVALLLIGGLVVWVIRGAPHRLDSYGDPLPRFAVMRLGSLRFVPIANQSNRIEYSPDGKYLSTGGFSPYGTVPAETRIWERATGRDVTPSKLRGVEATDVSWAPSGDRFVTSHRAVDSPGLLVWRVGRDRPVRVLDEKADCLSVDWSPAGELIATRTWQDEVLVFHEGGGIRSRWSYSGKRSMNSAHVLDFSPDGRQLAVVSDQGVRVHNPIGGQNEGDIPIETQTVFEIRMLDNSGAVAVATFEGVQVHHLSGPPESVRRFVGGAFATGISPDGQWIATGGGSPGAIWNFSTGERIELEPTQIYGGVAFSPDGSELALSTRRISFLKTGSWEPVPSHEVSFGCLLGGCTLSGNRLWTQEGGPSVVEWDLATGKAGRVFRPSQGARSLAYLGRDRLAIAGRKSAIELVECSSGRTLRTLPGHEDSNCVLSWSTQHNLLVSAGNSSLRAWNVETGQLEWDVPIESQEDRPLPPEIAVSPDGELLACGQLTAGASGSLTLYRVADGSSLWSKQEAIPGFFHRVAFTADSRQVVSLATALSAEDKKSHAALLFSETESGGERKRVELDSGFVYAFALSPDNKQAAVSVTDADAKKSLQLWSLDRPRLITTLDGHYETSMWLSFTEDGRRLVSCSQDSTALVWDIEAATGR